MAKINVMNLMELSQERIRQYLPEDYEMDDMGWDEEEEIFQICVFDVSKPPRTDAFGSLIETGPVDRFRFYRHAEETEEEVMERWNRELQEFCDSWKEVG